jgi:hypothetical protein
MRPAFEPDVRRTAILAGFLLALAVAPSALAASPGRWESKPSAPLPRQEAAFTLVGTEMHLVGGLEYGLPDSMRHDVYDTQTQNTSAEHAQSMLSRENARRD